MPRHKSNSDVDFRADRRKEVIVIDDGESLAANRPRRRASIPAAAKLAALARSEKAGDDEDCLIVSETRETPRRGHQPKQKTPGRASVAANIKRLARTAGLEVELNMECVEEALSHWQIQAAKRAEEEYRAALQQIRVAQAEVAAEQQRQLQQQQQLQLQRSKELQQQQQQQLMQMQQQRNQITIAPSTGHPTNMMRMNQPQVITPRPYHQKSRKQIINPLQYDTVQMTNRKSSAGNMAYTSAVVEGAFSPGVKRTFGSDFDTPQSAKRRTSSGSSRRTENEVGSWVPLDEYYYGKKEGDPAYREEKGEFRFKCWFCHKMLYNNIRMMLHMQAHIDSEKQQNLDLSDLTQCKSCYKQFDTPFDMQCHTERVHQNTSNVLVCRICEKDHENQVLLRTHMKSHHTACEMPYICQLCNFRSSIYSDVVDHFKKRHDSSQHTMCLYCLRVFRINFSKQNGWGLTQNYYQHLQRHQALNRKKKCQCCKLTFINAPEVKVHKTKDHLPNQKGAGLKAAISSHQGAVMIQVPEAGTKGKPNKPKSLNAPSVSKVRDLRSVRVSSGFVLFSKRCLECQEPMSGADHFKRYVECTMCRFATTCNNAYSNHMMAFHTGSATMTLKVVRNERRMGYRMYCLCGFSSNYGNSIANHLVFCSKRTAYSTKPEPKWFEYDDEQEDFNPFESYVDEPDVPEVDAEPKKDLTLLGALGLVKKKSDCSTPDLEEETPEQVAQYAVMSVIDAIFPAEAAAEEAIHVIMSRVEEQVAVKESLRLAEEELEKAKVKENDTAEAEKRLPKSKKVGRPKVSIMMGGYKAQKKDDREDSSKTEETELPNTSSLSREDSLQSFDEVASRDDSSTMASREDSLSRDAYSESAFRDDGDSLSRDSEAPLKDSAESLFAKAVAEESMDSQSQKEERENVEIGKVKSEVTDDTAVSPKEQSSDSVSKENEDEDVPMDTEESPLPKEPEATPMETDEDKANAAASSDGKTEDNGANENITKISNISEENDDKKANGSDSKMKTEDDDYSGVTTEAVNSKDEEAHTPLTSKTTKEEIIVGAHSAGATAEREAASVEPEMGAEEAETTCAESAAVGLETPADESEKTVSELETPADEPEKTVSELETPADEPEKTVSEPETKSTDPDTETPEEETEPDNTEETDQMDTAEGPKDAEPGPDSSGKVTQEETSAETHEDKSAESEERMAGEETKEEPREEEEKLNIVKETLDKVETQKDPKEGPKPEEEETKASDTEPGTEIPPSISGSSSSKTTPPTDKPVHGSRSLELGQVGAPLDVRDERPTKEGGKDTLPVTKEKSQDLAHQKTPSTSVPHKPEQAKTETSQSSRSSDPNKRPTSDNSKGHSSHRQGDYRDDRRRDDHHHHDSRKYDNRYGDRDRDRHGHRDNRDNRGYRDDRHGSRDRYGHQGGGGGGGDYPQGGYRRDQQQDRNRGWGGYNDRHDRRDQQGHRGGYRGGQGNRGGYNNRGGYHGYY